MTGARGGSRALALAVGLAACTHTVAVAPVPPPAKSVQLNAPGAPVDIAQALPAGYVTVVDFWGASCHACIATGGLLAVGVAQEPRVVIRKVDVGDGFTPVAQAYKIDALPHYFIYDKHQRLRYDLIGPDCLEAAKIAKQLAAE